MMKAVGLFSGGLDSALSAKIIQTFGIDVTAVYCCQPWQEADLTRIRGIAEGTGSCFHVIQLGEDYCDMLQRPRHGYGKGFNPCIDCHRFMIRKAGEFMREIGASFVFTGEVVGQRPMSQRKGCFPLVETGTGIERYVLRPLSARLLDPTVPEENGWVDRNRLFRISGRGRREQMDLARQFGVSDYLPPGGGCLLTEPHFGARLRDFLSWDYRTPLESAALKWGRYFRMNSRFIAIVGRDERENDLLLEHAHPQDHTVRLADAQGPLLLLKGQSPDETVFALAGGIVQRFSKFRDDAPAMAEYGPVSQDGRAGHVLAAQISEAEFKRMARQGRAGQADPKASGRDNPD